MTGARLVLLVEANVPVRQLLEDALVDGGLRVTCAGSAVEALQLLPYVGGEIAALVTDAELGGDGSGWALAAEVGRRRPGLPVVYLIHERGRLERHAVAPSAALTKPFKPDALLHALGGLWSDGPATPQGLTPR